MNNAKILLTTGPAEPLTRNTAREDDSPETTTRRRQIIRLYLTAILLLSAMLTVYIWQSTKMVEVKLRIKTVEKDIANLENGNADLRAEISKLQSLARIEKVAKTDLGMVVPRRLIYITMPDNWNKKMSKQTPVHQSVLVDAVVKYALPEAGRVFVDGTFGLGGHTRAVLSAYPSLERVIGIDRDAEILEYSCKTLDDPRIKRFQANASSMNEVLAGCGLSGVDGILLDLGVSSWQIDNPARGFSFSKPGPLDMRMNTDEQSTAADLVNNLSREDLTRIFFEYGEEKFSRRIADAIVRQRDASPFTTTDQLARIVSEAVPAANKRQSHIHPATRVFQALRIAVNKELEEVEDFLSIALSCLNPGGHLTIIAFHSLEDRLVKNFMQKNQKGCECPAKFPVCICGKKPLIEILTRKAIFAEESEIENNPRARSARLRSARKLEAGAK